jgi:hypothetical protein
MAEGQGGLCEEQLRVTVCQFVRICDYLLK